MAVANIDGLIVTVPYKARAARLAHRLGPTARRIGALNALRREADGTWSGDMFDGAGFVRAAQRKGETLRGRKVALFGAGGAGSAIACELASAGVVALSIIDPQRDRATALAAALGDAFPGCRIEPADASSNIIPASIAINDISRSGCSGGHTVSQRLPGPIFASVCTAKPSLLT